MNVEVPSASASLPFRILLIDDDSEVTRALQRLLVARGYAVREENDATQAVETARAFQPDAVILDFLMPESDGGEVAWQFWMDSRLRKVRIAVCSSAERQELVRRMPPTVVNIFEKPYDADALLALLAQWARRVVA
jgi:two-component system OmpR family response regulator